MPIELDINQYLANSEIRTELSSVDSNSPRIFYFGGRHDWGKTTADADETSVRMASAILFPELTIPLYVITQSDLLNEDLNYWVKEHIVNDLKNEEIDEAFRSLVRRIFDLDEIDYSSLDSAADKLAEISANTTFLGFSFGNMLIQRAKDAYKYELEHAGFNPIQIADIMGKVSAFHIGTSHEIRDEGRQDFTHIHFLLSNDSFAAYFCQIREKEHLIPSPDIFGAIVDDAHREYNSGIIRDNPNIPIWATDAPVAYYNKGMRHLCITSRAELEFQSFKVAHGEEAFSAEGVLLASISPDKHIARPADPEHHSLAAYINVTGVHTTRNGENLFTVQQNHFAHLIPGILQQSRSSNGVDLISKITSFMESNSLADDGKRLWPERLVCTRFCEQTYQGRE